jgi:hypothetical protein
MVLFCGVVIAGEVGGYRLTQIVTTRWPTTPSDPWIPRNDGRRRQPANDDGPAAHQSIP